MDNSPTLRRRHNPLQMSSSNEDDSKHRNPKRYSSLKRTLAVVLAGLLFLCRHSSTQSAKASLAVAAAAAAQPAAAIRNPHKPEFDCAIFWLRMPKTASTTIAQTFIRPLFREGNFTNVDLGPNSCITHAGGCASFWKRRPPARGGGVNPINDTRKMNLRRDAGHSINMRGLSPSYPVQSVPPFGRKVPRQQYGRNQRCFPSEENQKIGRGTMCHEYDPMTSTLNFGKRPPQGNKKELPSRVRGQFNAGPRITTHVGLDPSLFGWILPPKPMVFSTFRDPLERIFSSFHYGIQFGGGRPGAVGKCNLPGVQKAGIQERVKLWEEKVVKAREIATLQNNTEPYQSLLRQYLTTCKDAVDNAYVQFLDPDTKNVDVAIQNLEEYVIVGLQTDMGETLTRWVNITRRSCKSHKHFGKMEKVFAGIFDGMTADGEVKRFRESKITVNEANDAQRRLSVVQNILHVDTAGDEDIEAENTKQPNEINLVSLDFSTLDDDLKEMITRFTAGDQKVWKKVLELYELQKEWGRQ